MLTPFQDVYLTLLDLFENIFLLDNDLANVLALITNIWLWVLTFSILFIFSNRVARIYFGFWIIVSLLILGNHFLDFSSIFRTNQVIENNTIIGENKNYNGYFEYDLETNLISYSNFNVLTYRIEYYGSNFVLNDAGVYIFSVQKYYVEFWNYDTSEEYIGYAYLGLLGNGLRIYDNISNETYYIFTTNDEIEIYIYGVSNYD